MKKWKCERHELRSLAHANFIPARIRRCPFDKGKFLLLVRYRTPEGMRVYGRRAEELERVHRGSLQELRDLLGRYSLYQKNWSKYPDPRNWYRVN